MATRIKPVEKDLYDEDFYVWTLHQAELLRAGALRPSTSTI